MEGTPGVLNVDGVGTALAVPIEGRDIIAKVKIVLGVVIGGEYAKFKTVLRVYIPVIVNLERVILEPVVLQ